VPRGEKVLERGNTKKDEGGESEPSGPALIPGTREKSFETKHRSHDSVGVGQGKRNNKRKEGGGQKPSQGKNWRKYVKRGVNEENQTTVFIESSQLKRETMQLTVVQKKSLVKKKGQ